MFRFTIRDLLWLTVVVALGVAWWVRERQLGEMRRWEPRAEILKREVERGGLKVDWHGDGVSFTKKDYLPNPSPLAPNPPEK